MQTIATAVPDDLIPHQGEEIQFQVLVQADGTFLVTHVLHREPPAATTVPGMTISEWARKWGGTMRLGPGETVESLREAYTDQKFGS